MKNTKITRAELDAATDVAMAAARAAADPRGVLDKRPPGFFTSREYEEKHGLLQPNAYNQLNRLVRRGVLKKVWIKNVAMTGGPAVPAYGLVKKS